MSRGDQGAAATATEEYAGARSDINKDDTQGQERPRSEEEPQAEAKSQNSENQIPKSENLNQVTEMSHRPKPKSRKDCPKRQLEGLQKDEERGTQQRQGRRWSLKWQVKTSRKSRGDEE